MLRHKTSRLRPLEDEAGEAECHREGLASGGAAGEALSRGTARR